MAIRFIRQPSDTPNVSNTDDARMIRYAYGNQNGYVKNAGNELEPTVNGNQFKINSGVVVLQGWESEIDSNGFVVTVDNVATPRYYSVYYEVNLATQTTSIRVVYDISGYVVLPDGDDLTAVQSGTARLLLYRFSATSGVISNVVKRVQPIEYSGEPLEGYDLAKGTIEERLTDLGFKQGAFEISNADGTPYTDEITTNTITKQGKYAIGNFELNLAMAGAGYIQAYITIPDGFKPAKATQASILLTYGNLRNFTITTISESGKFIVMTLPGTGGAHQIKLTNFGWEIA